MSRSCEDCGGNVEPGWLVCDSCRADRDAVRAARPVIDASITAFAERLAGELDLRAEGYERHAARVGTESAVQRAELYREIANIIRRAACSEI